MPQGLPRKIRHAFVAQALLASLALVFGVALVTMLTRDALVRQRLEVEAAAFWARSASGGEAYLPTTGTIRGYFGSPQTRAEAIPEYVQSLPSGVSFLYRAQRGVLVDPRRQGTLYLVVDTGIVDLMLWRSAGLLIVLGLLAVLVITRQTYRKSREMVLPINRFAEDVSRWDPSLGDGSSLLLATGDDESREVRTLSAALQGLVGRVNGFVQRERDFTRDASHELRTPLTVIRVAGDMMLSDPSMPAHSRRPLERIQRAGRDMEAVIDAFLILAREGGVAPVSEEFHVRDVVIEEVEKLRPLLTGKPVELRVLENASPRLFAPPGVLAVVVSNLIHNACTFTEAGGVDVVIEHDAVVVRDTGIGMSEETLRHAFEPFYRADAFRPLGKGFGLSIASRLARRFGWQLSLDSTPGQGTIAILRFVPAKY